MQVSLASDFMWNWNAREATASFGYDYMLRQCRLRGRIDSEGKVGSAQHLSTSWSSLVLYQTKLKLLWNVQRTWRHCCFAICRCQRCWRSG